MKSPALALRVASMIFGLMCLGQLTRLLVHINLQIGPYYVQRRWSALAVIVLACLSVWLWTVASKAAKSSAGPSA